LPIELSSTSAAMHTLTAVSTSSSRVAAGDSIELLLSVNSPSTNACSGSVVGSISLVDDGGVHLVEQPFSRLLPLTNDGSTSLGFSFVVPDDLPDGTFSLVVTLESANVPRTHASIVTVVSNRVDADLTCPPTTHGVLTLTCTIENTGSLRQSFGYRSAIIEPSAYDEWLDIKPGESKDIAIDLIGYSADRQQLDIFVVAYIGSNLTTVSNEHIVLPLASEDTRSADLTVQQTSVQRIVPGGDEGHIEVHVQLSLDLANADLAYDTMIDGNVMSHSFSAMSKSVLINVEIPSVDHCQPVEFRMILMVAEDRSEVGQLILPVDDCASGDLPDFAIGDFSNQDSNTVVVEVLNIGSRPSEESVWLRVTIDGDITGLARVSSIEPGDARMRSVSLDGPVDWNLTHMIDIEIDTEREVLEGSRSNNRHVESSMQEDSASSIDSDGDGLPDSLEGAWTVAYCPSASCIYELQAAMYDGGTDGHDIWEEYLTTSDPFDPDTDDDGLNDRLEWIHGSAADNSDTDGDGIPDGQEAIEELLIPPMDIPRIQLLTYENAEGEGLGRSPPSTEIDTFTFHITSPIELAALLIRLSDGSEINPTFVRTEGDSDLYSAAVPSSLTPDFGSESGGWPIITATTIFGVSSILEANASSNEAKRWSASEFEPSSALVPGALLGLIGVGMLGAAAGFCYTLLFDLIFGTMFSLLKGVKYLKVLQATGLIAVILALLLSIGTYSLLELLTDVDMADMISPFEGNNHDIFREYWIVGAIIGIFLGTLLNPATLLGVGGRVADNAVKLLDGKTAEEIVGTVVRSPTATSARGLVGDAADSSYPGAKAPKMLSRWGDDTINKRIELAYGTVFRHSDMYKKSFKPEDEWGKGGAVSRAMSSVALEVIKARVLLSGVNGGQKQIDNVVREFYTFLKNNGKGHLGLGKLNEFITTGSDEVIGFIFRTQDGGKELSPQFELSLDKFKIVRDTLYIIEVYTPSTPKTTQTMVNAVRDKVIQVEKVINNLNANPLIRTTLQKMTNPQNDGYHQSAKILLDFIDGGGPIVGLVEVAGKHAFEVMIDDLPVTVTKNNKLVTWCNDVILGIKSHGIQLVGFDSLGSPTGEDDDWWAPLTKPSPGVTWGVVLIAIAIAALLGMAIRRHRANRNYW
jgi:hypothetical protein